MSGLNAGYFILEIVEQLALEEQRRKKEEQAEELRRAREEKERHDTLVQSVRADVRNLKEQCRRILESSKGTKTPAAADAARELEALVARMDSAVAGAASMDAKSLTELRRQIRAGSLSARELESIMQVEQRQSEQLMQAALETARLAAFDGAGSSSFADLEGAAPEDAPAPEAMTSEEMNAAKMRASLQLRELSMEESLPKSMHGEIADALRRMTDIQDSEFLGNFLALTAKPLVKKARSFVKEAEENREAFDRMRIRYETLCEMYGYVEQSFEPTAASMESMRSEIARIEEETAEDDERAYINEAIDEVMEEMGYSVLGSREVTKKSGRHFRNELYDYGEGTAVSVTYSDDGRIAMELGALDIEDRQPDEEETRALCESMEHFCADHDEIVRRLRKRGILLSNPQRRPPEPAYAQVINTSDFEMTKDAKTFRAARRRNCRSKPGALQADGQ